MLDARPRILPALTGIRFIAAMMVLFFHFGAGFAGRANFPRPVVTLLENGYAGVSLFFVLSGFIITYTYTGHLNSSRDYRDFAVARFARIYPVYLLSLLIALPFSRHELTPIQVGAVLAMVQSWTWPESNFGFSWVTQAWTLSVELFFYLCAPLLLAALRSTRKSVIATMAAAFGMLLPLFWIPTISPSQDRLAMEALAYVPIPALRLIEFIYGASLCQLFLREPRRLSAIASDVLVVLNIVIILAILMLSKAGMAIGAAVTLAGILLVQLASGTSVVARLLGSRLMLLLGASSYALYLMQGPVREWLRLLLGETLSQPLSPIVTIALSVLVFRFWEEPARKWLRRLVTEPTASEPPRARPGALR